MSLSQPLINIHVYNGAVWLRVGGQWRNTQQVRVIARGMT